jgi:uncharacterized protein YejL (UPF0352 family)
MFGTIASRFNDAGVTALFEEVVRVLKRSRCAPFPLGAVALGAPHQALAPGVRR